MNSNRVEPAGPGMERPASGSGIPEFAQVMGHPRPLWMLFMTEFWERFAFYGMRWALVLYIVAQFYGSDASGEAPASELYGAYLALVYAGAIFGGYVADKVIGYQRSILLGAVFMATGLFLITVPTDAWLKLGLATVIADHGFERLGVCVASLGWGERGAAPVRQRVIAQDDGAQGEVGEGEDEVRAREAQRGQRHKARQRASKASAQRVGPIQQPDAALEHPLAL